MKQEYKSTLRQEFLPGEVAILDKGFANSLEVVVLSQTKEKLFTTIHAHGDEECREWDVMTNRLTKKEDGDKTEIQ